MQNKLEDLNNYLFEELCYLTDRDITPQELTSEIKRATAISKIAENIISNAALSVNFSKLKLEYGTRKIDVPEMLEIKGEEK